jgi:hypothetical protein
MHGKTHMVGNCLERRLWDRLQRDWGFDLLGTENQRRFWKIAVTQKKNDENTILEWFIWKE